MSLLDKPTTTIANRCSAFIPATAGLYLSVFFSYAACDVVTRGNPRNTLTQYTVDQKTKSMRFVAVPLCRIWIVLMSYVVLWSFILIVYFVV